MNFNLSGACANCPFRTDVAANYGWLGRERATEIAESLNEWAFPCHKTTDHYDEEYEHHSNSGKEQHCYGALVVLENEGKLFQNRMMQIAQRLGLFKNYARLNLNLPIVENRVEFIAMHSDGYYAFVMRLLLSMSAEEKKNLVGTYTQQFL